MTKPKKREEAITLVALIITIIILIIIAAVTVKLAFETNMIGIATKGTENYTEAQVGEKKEFEELEGFLREKIEVIEYASRENDKPELAIKGMKNVGYNEKYVSDITIKIKPVLANSKYIKYTVTGAENYEKTVELGEKNEIEFILNKDGEYEISALSIDAEGNSSESTSKKINRDATPPSQASISIKTIAEKDISVTANGKDNESGIASYEFEYKENTEEEWHKGPVIETPELSCNYTYEGLTGGKNYELRVTIIDQAGNLYTGNSVNATTKIIKVVTPTAANDIGKYVNYKPTHGTYWEDKAEDGTVGNISTFSGDTTNTQFGTEENLKWRIWNVSGGRLYLISDVPTTQQLGLKSIAGYNNGVTLLDNICNSCYKNSSYSGITAKNLKIEDIIEVVTVENTNTYYGKTRYTYNIPTPYIWTTNEKSQTNATKNRSVAYKLTTKYMAEQARVTPYGTLWAATGLNKTSSCKHPKYVEIFAGGSSWLSSRYVEAVSNTHCSFGFQYIYGNGGVGSVTLCTGQTNSSGMVVNGSKKAVRPVVAIPLSSCIVKTSITEGMDYDISPK